MKNKKNDTTPSVKTVVGNPKTTDELLNAYGTYEIQPTANTENEYPFIAQGYNKKIKTSDGENKKNNK